MDDQRAELVRISPNGEAHAIGKVASQRLRARAGTHRLLPSPAHVVFMRYTGDDGRRDAEDGAVVRLAGEITHHGDICDVLAMLGQTGWRGELNVSDGEVSRSLFIAQGNVLGVVTSKAEERLGAVLYRFGALSDEQHEAVVAKLGAGGRYGDAAVELGFVSQETVYHHIRRQIEEVTFATLTVNDGTFFFLDGYDESRLAARHTVSINGLLMDGVTRMDELLYFREKIPSSDHVPVRLDNREPPADEYSACYAVIDGRLSVEEIGRASSLGEFAVTKQIYALVQSKHVAVHPPRLSGGAHALVETANDALRLILRGVDETEKGQQVREGLASFAIGAGVYDILFRGAGPNAHGELDAGRVAENSVIIAGGSDPETVLKQMLHEYVSFALFSAGGAMGSGAVEERLNKEVSRIIAYLRPMG